MLTRKQDFTAKCKHTLKGNVALQGLPGKFWKSNALNTVH